MSAPTRRPPVVHLPSPGRRTVTAGPVGLPVSEVFGPTLQGEGPAAGQPATFIRLGGCNLACTWCDSPYTWDAQRYDLRTEITRRPVEDLLGAVTTPLVVVTGGEPLLHQGAPGWRALLHGLDARDVAVHVETNGTIAPTPLTAAAVALAVVSPKLEHADAGARTGRDPVHTPALAAWAALARQGRAILKVVVRDTADCDDAVLLADAHDWPRTALWLMPEGTTPATLATRWPAVASYAAAHGCCATHRLHVLAWNDERGH